MAIKLAWAQQCLKLALQSDCTIMKFGAMLVKDGQSIGSGFNKKIHPCVARFGCCEYRKNVRPRSHTELCEAVHAEWVALHNAVSLGYNPRGASMVICGMGPSGKTWIREGPWASCTLCTRLLMLFGIKDLLLQVKAENKRGWKFVRVPIKQALIASFEIAFGYREIKRIP